MLDDYDDDDDDNTADVKAMNALNSRVLTSS